MRIWKVAVCILPALASGGLGYRADATLSKSATSAAVNLELPAETLTNQSFSAIAAPEQTELEGQGVGSIKGVADSRYESIAETPQDSFGISQNHTFVQQRRIKKDFDDFNLQDDFTDDDFNLQDDFTDQEALMLLLNTVQVAQQGVMLSDIQGHWAQDFIEFLTNRGIIQGFVDGTFRPDEPVTRAQFAAMLKKAFQKNPVRSEVQFVDTPANYWASTAIQAAYKMDFLQGYPGNIFNPEENIPRVQALVSLVNGLNLSTENTIPAVLNTYFQDASEIPEYAREKVVAALQNRLVVNHPNVKTFNPNQVATRAEVAAFIYQALVKAGMTQELTTSQAATQYIVDYKPLQNTAPEKAELEELRQRFLLPSISPQLRGSTGVISAPGSSIASPSAFGAEFGDVFLGGSYQSRARFTNVNDAGVVFGFGLGKAEIVGLEVAVSSFSTFRQGFFTNAGISLKLHHSFPDNLAIALGAEDAATFGNPDAGSSIYGVISKVFILRDDYTKPFSSVTVSLGLGGGRFRSEHDYAYGINSVNVFGSIGVRVLQPISLIADWTGQDLTLGASIAPLRNIPIVITPAFADVTGNAGDGARFILGVGVGYRL